MKTPPGKFPLIDLVRDYPKLVTDPAKLQKLDAKSRVQQYFAWARERHSIYLLKSLYKTDPPWSDFPHMSTTRWCNVYRELDKVTQEIVRESYMPNIGSPYLWFTAMICRYINHPDSLRELRDANQLGISGRWDWRKAAEILDSRKKSRQKFVTGAYLVNSVSSSDFPPEIIGSKPHVICYRLQAAWERREELKGEFKDSMERAFNAISSVSGFGPFLSYQSIVDLSYSRQWLKHAPDYNTFNSAGPGTKRGVQRVKYGRTKANFEVITQSEVTDFLLQILEHSKDPNFWPQTNEKNMGNGWAPLSMSNCSNVFCETDKNFRIVLGEGETRSRYTAIQASSLF